MLVMTRHRHGLGRGELRKRRCGSRRRQLRGSGLGSTNGQLDSSGRLQGERHQSEETGEVSYVRRNWRQTDYCDRPRWKGKGKGKGGSMSPAGR